MIRPRLQPLFGWSRWFVTRYDGWRRALFFCGWLCAFFSIFSLPKPARADALQSLRFSHVTQEQGLPSSGVTVMLQDSKGYVWLGTWNGLARFDGRHMQSFSSDQKIPTTLSNRLILALLEDEEEKLWIGTRSGLDRFDLRTNTLERQEMPKGMALQNRRVTGIVAAGKGRLWVATVGGLFLFDTKSRAFTTWQAPASARHPFQGRLQAIIADGKDGIWLAQGNSVAHLDADGALGTGISTLDVSAEKPANPVDFQVRSLALDGNNRLWVGMERGLQIWHVNDGLIRPDALPRQLAISNNIIRTIFKDTDQAMWIGQGDTQGLSRWLPGTTALEHFSHNPAIASSLSSGSVLSLMQDRNGSLWVGTAGGGADQTDLRGKRFSSYLDVSSETKRIGSSLAMAVVPDGEDAIWLGSYGGGLSHLNLRTGATERIPPKEVPLMGIKTLLRDPQGLLWAGGDGGLLRFDPKAKSSTVMALHESISAGASISSLVRDSEENVWAGSAAGLYRIDQGLNITTFRANVQDQNALQHDIVDCLLIDREKHLWIGTKGGLHLWEPVSAHFLRVIKPSSAVPDPSRLAIQGMRQDSSGRIWLATDAGLFELEKQAQDWQLRSWTTIPGMPKGGFEAIQDALNGEIWLGSDLGLTRVFPSQQKARVYPGLINYAGSINFGAAARGTDGSLYFGALGLIRFKPELLRDNLLPPRLILSDILLFNRSLNHQHDDDDGQTSLTNSAATGPKGEREYQLSELGITTPLHSAKTVRFNHEHAMISFELSALQFYNRNQNRYAWKLEGVDKNWIYGLTDQGMATYTNLDPGRYRLLAKAANPDGIWSEEQALIDVIVLPPFWRTWWWYSGLSLLALLMLIAVYRWRVKSLRINQHYLEQEVGARTKEAVEQREAAEKARNDITWLSEIGREITASLEINAIHESLYQYITQLVEISTFGIGLVDWERRLIAFDFVIENGKLFEPYQRSLDAAEQPSTQCVLKGQEILVDENTVDTRKIDTVMSKHIDRQDGSEDDEKSRLLLLDGEESIRARSGIYIPLTINGKVIGVMGVHSGQANAFSATDLSILRTLSAYAAVAFDNANAYHCLQLTQAKLVEQEKLAALGSLVAGVAHELNTPLGNSLLAASAMQEMSEKFAEEIQTGKMRRSTLEDYAKKSDISASILMRNLSTAADLISSFKQIAVDRASDQRRQFSLLTVCEEVARTISNRIRREDHNLTIKLPGDIMLDSYPGPFGQVLTNLIVNAMVHGFEGRKQGQMQLEGRRLDDGHVLIIFSDNGLGIKEEHLGKIFDPFFTTRLGQGGSGLGLHISYNIITVVLGGSIKVKSKLGEGTSFEIVLPLLAPKESAATPG